jgi:hypothetical protein
MLCLCVLFECKLSCILIKYILAYHIKHVVSLCAAFKQHTETQHVVYGILKLFNKYARLLTFKQHTETLHVLYDILQYI